LKAQFSQWWGTRTQGQRERVLGMVWGIAALLILFTVVFPMLQYHQLYAQRLPALQASVDQLHIDADEALSLRQHIGGAANAHFQNLGPALAGHIEQSAAEAGIKGQIQSINTLENGQVELVLPKVNFNRFLTWTDQLKRSANVRIQTLNATSLDHSGGVQVRVVLKQIAPASS